MRQVLEALYIALKQLKTSVAKVNLAMSTFLLLIFISHWKFETFLSAVLALARVPWEASKILTWFGLALAVEFPGCMGLIAYAECRAHKRRRAMRAASH